MTDASIDIGISTEDRQAITDGLGRLLADSYTLYLKTHNYHWNVTGPMFQTLHLMFETHYNELWLANDLIAERIRALGFPGRLRPPDVDPPGGRPARRRGDDPSPRRRPGDGGPDGPLDLPRGRGSARRAHRGPADPAPPGAREDGLDAPQPPGVRAGSG
jgi:hypothetical protein